MPNPDAEGNMPHGSSVIGAAIVEINIPSDAYGILVQATDQNIRYTLTGNNPSVVSGFRLTAGNDPLLIGLTDNTILRFVAEAAGARLEYMWVQ